MKNKKIIIMGVILTFIFGMISGCGFSSNKNQEEKSPNVVNDNSDKKSTETDSEIGKAIVVYYSASGYTKEAANIIAKDINADVFELKPIEPYTDDDLNWRDDNSRVTKEHENADSRNVELTTTTVDNWDSYDTVFVGYPIWWGIAAWPIDGFVKANDFTGKTVIPFCTSTSSGIGDSGNLLAEMAGTGNWLEGERFRSDAAEKDIQKWVEGLSK